MKYRDIKTGDILKATDEVWFLYENKWRLIMEAQPVLIGKTYYSCSFMHKYRRPIKEGHPHTKLFQ